MDSPDKAMPLLNIAMPADVFRRLIQGTEMLFKEVEGEAE